MMKIKELDGVDCVDNDDLGNAVEQLLHAAQIVIDLQEPRVGTAKKFTVEQEIEGQFQAVQKNPLLVSCMVIIATLERFRVDYAYQQNSTQLLLQDIVESIDCAGAKPIEHWKQSDKAAIDKANELGINILPEYSMADLRYKIDCAIHEVI